MSESRCVGTSVTRGSRSPQLTEPAKRATQLLRPVTGRGHLSNLIQGWRPDKSELAPCRRYAALEQGLSLSVSADVCILFVADLMRAGLNGAAFLPQPRLTIEFRGFCHETLFAVPFYV